MDEGHRRRARLGAAEQVRAQVVEGGGEGRRAGGIVCAVEQDLAAEDVEELEPAGPRRARIASATGRGAHRSDARRGELVEQGVGDGRVLGLVPAAERDSRRTEGRELDVDAIAVPAHERRRADLEQRCPNAPRSTADDRERVARRTRHGPIAALDDRRLLARDRRDRVAEPGHVVEGDVRDRRDAAVPGVRGVEPPAQADLDERDLDPLLGEPAEEHGREQLELRRRPVSTLVTTSCAHDLPNEPRERHRVDRPAVDLQPLAVADEVRLGGRPDPGPGCTQRGSGEGQDAALAIRAADERTPQLELRIAECLEERACPSQAQTDPEPPALGQDTHGGVVRRNLRGVRPAQRALSSSS